MNTFFVTGLPRSRTAWMATYLTYGRTFCFHDGFTELSNPRELKSKFESVLPRMYTVGNSDPANLYFVDTLVEMYPLANWVLIKRDVNECIKSAREAFGVCGDMAYELAQIKKLEKYAQSGHIILQTVPFEKIDEMVAKGKFKYLLDEDYGDREKMFSTMQIQLTEERLSQKDLLKKELLNHIDKNECILA